MLQQPRRVTKRQNQKLWWDQKYLWIVKTNVPLLYKTISLKILWVWCKWKISVDCSYVFWISECHVFWCSSFRALFKRLNIPAITERFIKRSFLSTLLNIWNVCWVNFWSGDLNLKRNINENPCRAISSINLPSWSNSIWKVDLHTRKRC